MLTRMNRGSMYGLCLVALAGLPASAYAQVGTPPPVKDDAGDTYAPPPPPQSFTAEGRAELEAQAEQRRAAEAQRAQAQAEKARAEEPVEPKYRGIPNVNIPAELLKNRNNSLVRGDGKGGLYPWWGPLDLHALKISPLVGDLNADKIRTVVYDRHNRVEQRLIANLDLFREIEATKDDLGQDGGIAKFSEITSIIEPIVEKGSLSIDLYNAGAISAMQGKFNEEMVRAYKREETAALRSDNANPISGFVKFMVEDAMREPRFAHDLMVGEILSNFDEVMEKAGIDKSELAPVAEMAGQVDEDGPKRPLIQRATPYIMALALDEHTSLLMAVRELREDPNHQPLLKVELLKDGQEPSVMVPGDELKGPGGVYTGYAALDPDGTGGAVARGLSAEQLPHYLEYLKKAWRVRDPDATGKLMEKMNEDYKAEYQAYLDARRVELGAGGTDPGASGG